MNNKYQLLIQRTDSKIKFNGFVTLECPDHSIIYLTVLIQINARATVIIIESEFGILYNIILCCIESVIGFFIIKKNAIESHCKS